MYKIRRILKQLWTDLFWITIFITLKAQMGLLRFNKENINSEKNIKMSLLCLSTRVTVSHSMTNNNTSNYLATDAVRIFAILTLRETV